MAAADHRLPKQRNECKSMVPGKRHKSKHILSESKKIRESVLEESCIIPIEPPQAEIQTTAEIRIEAGSITVTLPESISSDRLTAVIAALKC